MRRNLSVLFLLAVLCLPLPGHAWIFIPGQGQSIVEINAQDNRTITSDEVCNGWANINNYGQTAQNVMNSLPAAGANCGFTATISTTVAANNWGFRVHDGDTIYCDGNSTGKTSCSFLNPIYGQYMCCWTYQSGVLTYAWQCRTVVAAIPVSSLRLYTANLGGETLPPWALEGHFFNVGAATYGLPPAVLGMYATFIMDDNGTFYLDADASDHFMVDGVAYADGHKLASPNVGSKQVEIVCNKDHVWTIRHRVGTFSDGGA